jgi:hypothetical protein
MGDSPPEQVQSLGHDRGGNLGHAYAFAFNDPLQRVDTDGQVAPLILVLVGGTLLLLEGHDVEPPVSGTDQLVNHGIVPACQIIVFVGHNRTAVPHLPSRIQTTGRCSMGSAVACYSSTIPVESQIPGIDPRPTEFEKINFAQAANMALGDFNAGVASVKQICGDKKCCCKQVTVEIVCMLSKWDLRNTWLKGVCGKKQTVQCSSQSP